MVRYSVVNDNDDYIRINVQIKKNNSYPWLLNGMAINSQNLCDLNIMYE